jgi:hypothetical protein
MNRIKKLLAGLALVTVAMAQSSEPPLNDSRLSVHTLVREDMFAGFLSDNMERFARGEKSIDLLQQKRPEQRANLLSWKGQAEFYRAVRAYEGKRPDEFKVHYTKALDSFAEARKLIESGSDNDGVYQAIGGSHVIFADRLPKELRGEAWARAYEAYQIIWKQQASFIDRLPIHFKGEVLGGLAQSSQRTGRTEELGHYLDKILELLQNTPYEAVARQWKTNPASASSSRIACVTCHDQGRLGARLTSLNKQ